MAVEAVATIGVAEVVVVVEDEEPETLLSPGLVPSIPTFPVETCQSTAACISGGESQLIFVQLQPPAHGRMSSPPSPTISEGPTSLVNPSPNSTLIHYMTICTIRN